MNESAKMGEVSAAVVIRGGEKKENVEVAGLYTAVCRDQQGNVKWTDEAPNLVTTVGRNDLFDKYLAGSAYTAAFYMGLIQSVSFTGTAAGDTMASHSGWIESSNYAAANNPAVTWNAASGGNKASNGAVSFAINANFTVVGPILKTTDIKAGNTGVLYSAGAFSGGNKVVQNGDTLTVTYSATSS